MNTLLFLFIAAVAIVIAWIVFTFVHDFAAASGSTWQRLLTAADDFATKLWAKFTMLVGLLSTGLISLADYLNDPGLSAAIKDWLKPEYVASFVVVAALITIMARNRTLKS